MRLNILLLLVSLAGTSHGQSVWDQVKRKTQQQINKSTQLRPNSQPTTSAPNASNSNTGAAQRPGTTQATPGRNSYGLYYWCQGAHKKGHSYSQVFQTDNPATLVATLQFAQYLADKYKQPIFLREVGCTDTQRTEEVSSESRQHMMDMSRDNAKENVIEEDWTFTAHPTIEEDRAAGSRMSSETKIFPTGSGGQAADDAAVQATPEYAALVESEFQNARPACEQNEMMSSFYNCACEADALKAERHKTGGTIARAAGGRGVLHPTAYDLLEKAELSGCAQSDGIKAYAYKRAMASQLLNIPEDVRKRVAECTADKLEASYLAKPIINIRVVDNYFTNSLVACHTR